MNAPEAPPIPTYRKETAASVPYLQVYGEGKTIMYKLLDGTEVEWHPSEVLEVERMRVVEGGGE